MRSLTRVLASAVCAVAALGLAGCGSSTAASDQSDASSKPTLTVGDLGYLEPLAKASGMLKDAPYKVKWAVFPSPTPGLAALGADKVDVLYTGDTPILQALSSNRTIKVVGAFQHDGSGSAVVAEKNSPVRSVADLKGKTVVVSPAQGSINDYLLQNSLQSAGMSSGDVKIRYMPPSEAWAAFSSGQIDIWSTGSPFISMALGEGAHKIVDGTGGRIPGLNFVSASDRVLADAAKKKALTDFLGRLDQAVAWSHSHSDELAKALAVGPVTLPLAKLVISQSPKKAAPLNVETIRTIQRTADNMTDFGMLSAKLTVSPAIATDVFPTQSATP